MNYYIPIQYFSSVEMIDKTKLEKYYNDLFDNASCAYKIFTDDFCKTFTNLDFNVNDAMLLFDIFQFLFS